jgi:hypothetical protein
MEYVDDAMIYIPSFIKIGSCKQTSLGGADTDSKVIS